MLMREGALVEAAKALQAKDSGFDITYGSHPNEVVVTVHAGVGKSDMKSVVID